MVEATKFFGYVMQAMLWVSILSVLLAPWINDMLKPAQERAYKKNLDYLSGMYPIYSREETLPHVDGSNYKLIFDNGHVSDWITLEAVNIMRPMMSAREYIVVNTPVEE